MPFPKTSHTASDDHLIQKIECVGHVQKRMSTRLRKLKLVYGKKKLSDGKTIGGKGRLTDSLIDKLAHYYGNAIRCNSTSVKEMRKAIWAVCGHSSALMMNRCTGFVLQIQMHGLCFLPRYLKALHVVFLTYRVSSNAVYKLGREHPEEP
ncbi:uncharacterized protein TNCV_5085991 [Trichonephila clavipes]|uniref:Mutator-like transposase domain-containing protein n=1 Tax=Trichonephila clavipes TaxID=2585209 RepID=A0A8X6VCD1_TRICX|nr:uncharacterized protein TNCV_5085991 [Trichonephila clavipes]